MLELVWFSTKLFFQGKLLRDPFYFFKQIIFGSFIALFILIASIQIGLGLWLPIIIASFFTGLIMPFLLKDLKIGSFK